MKWLALWAGCSGFLTFAVWAFFRHIDPDYPLADEEDDSKHTQS